MFSHSSRSIRVRGISHDTEKQELLAECSKKLLERPLSKMRYLRRTQVIDTNPPIVSLAPQHEYQIGTVTFSSKAHKRRALKQKWRWSLDDKFDGLTVLHSSDSPDIDICAVHGLNGNAFDTWTADNGYMWLRDFLPTQLRFKTSRIMTFGYSSLLQDDKNAASLCEWAHSLLQAVLSVRKSPLEQARPIIFVCHSLGGLVVREAMIQLYDCPHLYYGLGVEQCGVLFLSTPHSGATAADWKDYLVELAGRIGRIRARDFARMLRSFNDESRRAKERFGRVKPTPPYICLGETRETSISGYAKLVVTLDSAGLNNQPARGVDGADHRTICRYFQDTDAGYIQIVQCLESISRKLRNSDADTVEYFRCYSAPPDHHEGETPDIRNCGARGSRGGSAWGGNALGDKAWGGDARGGNAKGHSARGGDARGGNAYGSNTRGGSAWGGNFEGANAWGGDAQGGDARDVYREIFDRSL